MSGLEQDGGGQDEEEEVFMPEDEGTVVADLEGQASDDEEDEDDENLETTLNEDMDMAVDMDEEFAVERNDACACLETGLENGSGAAAGSSSADNSSAEAVAAEAAKASQRKPVYAVKWNKMDPSIVSCGGEDDRVRLWKPFHTEGPNSITLHGHQDSVVALDFDSTGKALASGGMDGRVCVWSTMTGKLLCTLEGPGEAIEFVKWHPLGSVVLAGSEDMTMWMWNVDISAAAETSPTPSYGQCMQVFTGHNESVSSGGFTPDGKTVVSTSLDGTVKVWNPKTGECQHTFFQEERHQASYGGEEAGPPPERGITCLDFSPDSSMVLCGGIDCTAHLVNVSNNRVLWKFGGSVDTNTHVIGQQGGGQGGSHHQDSVETVSFHPSGQPLVATGSLDGLLIVWDANTSTPRVVCTHPRGVIRVQWAPKTIVSDAQSLLHDLCLFTCCLDGRIRLWDARSGQCQREFQGFTKSILDMDVSPDGRSVIAGSDDGTARVFQVV